jgi:hypothetical protein
MKLQLSGAISGIRDAEPGSSLKFERADADTTPVEDGSS